MAVADEMQLPGLDKARPVRSLRKPTGGTRTVGGVRGAVGDEVRPGAVFADLDVLQDDIRVANQVEVQLPVVVGAPAAVVL